MLRVLLFIHRYLAVAVGLLMALWCLSGFVMMYQSFPELTREEQLAGLAPLRFDDCCDAAALAGFPAGEFRIEMLDGRPVLRSGGAVVDLRSGAELAPPGQEALLRIAADHAANRGIGGTPRWLGEVGLDQWNIQHARRNAPVHHFAFDDAARTELYLNGRSGEVFQDTNRRERLLSWFGAIPHWLYPTLLRRDGALWSQVVIWASVIGTFLAATGLYVGIARLRRNRDGELASPFRGWWYWHHITGLVFGLITLTWVFSGLLTMNPWGWLEGGESSARLRPALQGSPGDPILSAVLESLPRSLNGQDFVQLRSVTFGGTAYVAATRADASRTLLHPDGRLAVLDEASIRAALQALDAPLKSLELLTTEDAYHYSHHRRAELPVWRAVLGDAEGTRLYISPVDASVRVIDRAAMQTRWLSNALHRLDFPVLRWRPVWDIVAMLLLAGATALCITGTWMAFQRIARDIRISRRQPR